LKPAAPAQIGAHAIPSPAILISYQLESASGPNFSRLLTTMKNTVLFPRSTRPCVILTCIVRSLKLQRINICNNLPFGLKSASVGPKYGLSGWTGFIPSYATQPTAQEILTSDLDTTHISQHIPISRLAHDRRLASLAPGHALRQHLRR
jgi:hypothetical protein